MDLVGLTKEDTQAILDGLAALPLARAYNTFNKVMQQAQADERLNAPPSPEASSPVLPLAGAAPQVSTPS
jgi:hypothetical protein